jgi:RNA polymerase sigma-70 factor (ECF subfamily)
MPEKQAQPADSKDGEASVDRAESAPATRAADLDLIRAASAGDLAAFRNLVDKYHGLVAATVIGMIGPGPEAEDLGQETFVRLFRTLDRFRGEASVGTYLTRIAINLCLNEIRGRKRRTLWGLLHLSSEAPVLDGQAEAESQDLQSRVRAAVLRLEPNLRAVVVLRWLEGYTTEAAAELLDIPMGTVLSRLYRAQGVLKQWLQPIQEKSHE